VRAIPGQWQTLELISQACEMSDSVRHTGSQCDAGRIPASTCPAPAGDVGDWTDFGETGDTGDTGETGDAGRGVVAASAAFPLSVILEAEIDSHGEIITV
jgi:hypothetical protein